MLPTFHNSESTAMTNVVSFVSIDPARPMKRFFNTLLEEIGVF